MSKIALIALAGACGTLCRYWLSGLVYNVMGRDFPWGTWAVNITGCFLFGLVWILSEERGLLSAQARILILTGFMGAFTTFSTFIFESGGILDDGQWLKLALNLAGQNVVGFAALYLGTGLGRIV
ncbi:CrcB protein [Desulfomicrobium macestii]|uniref:Fluoride-specific ion channel FluC n=2 Tax=Desulfomicrobium TaxID=898 RepID=A0A8G2F7D0_DESNO|nr:MULTISPECIES: fluoride efflux transporter CrcB [Desulfomicrobium]MBE1424387.1 CrcB protein [Desulfomicrobium macestii]SFL51302.1 CrcB protein [Desulfomicrobium norvegicum]